AIEANPEIAAAFDGPALVRNEATGDFEEGSKTGGQAYQTLVESLGQQGASHALFAAGIPGLRYLDGQSRSGGEGTHNYVIWDEAQISEPVRLNQAANFDQPAVGAIPEKVRQAEEVISAAQADDDLAILYHSGDASIDADLATGIEPTFGAWLEEVMAGAVDDEGTASAIREADPIAFYSESPSWVSMKAARAAGKTVRDITV